MNFYSFFSLQVKELVGKSVEKGSNYVADPSGLRTGNPPDEKMAQVLQDEGVKLEEYVSKVRSFVLLWQYAAITSVCSSIS